MRKAYRWIGAVLAAVVAALLFGTFVPRPLWPLGGPDGEPVRRILLLSNPIHTDIAIPIDATVLARFDWLVEAGVEADLPGVGYLVFGWGSRAFYINTPTWADLKPGPVFSALTIDNSVMHVDLAGDISEDIPAVSGWSLGNNGYDRLLDFIEASFQFGPDNAPIPIAGQAYGEYDAFFEANGTFNALAGCNMWTAKALRVAGLRTGWWNPLPQSLAVSLDLFNQSSGGRHP